MANFDPESAARPAAGPTEAWSIALDGGTTNTRAHLLRGTRLVATARREIGVRDTVLGDRDVRPSPGPGAAPDPESASGPPASGPEHRAHLVRAVREVVEEVGLILEGEVERGRGAGHAPRPEFLVAAGMLSAEVGLVAVPHVPAPAALDDLARATAVVDLPEVDDRPILVVPGVRTRAAEGPDGWFDSDVMRGEECETFGAYLALRGDGRIEPGRSTAFLWPGSHTKLVEVDAHGRITRSHTSLAGEMLQAVARHTLVSASLPRALPDPPDPEAAAAGARAVARDGLGRAAFLVRIAALSGALDPGGRASFWIGAVVAADLDGLARHPILEPGRPVFVGGRDPLRALYATGLARRHAGPVVPLELSLAQAASALGACAVAAHRR